LEEGWPLLQFGQSPRHCCLSCTLALRVLLGGKREHGQYQYLALGCSLLLGGILGCKWKLGWLRNFVLGWLLVLVHSSYLISLFGRDNWG